MKILLVMNCRKIVFLEDETVNVKLEYLMKLSRFVAMQDMNKQCMPSIITITRQK